MLGRLYYSNENEMIREDTNTENTALIKRIDELIRLDTHMKKTSLIKRRRND